MRPTLVAALALAAPLLLAAAIPALTVSAGGRSETLDAAALAALPHETVTVVDHDRPRTYSGVTLSTLAMRLGAPNGPTLHGRALAAAWLATASDGYRVALSAGEADPATSGRRVLVADREDGRPLAEHDGPFRLVVEGDPRPARAARGLVSLELKPVG